MKWGTPFVFVVALVSLGVVVGGGLAGGVWAPGSPPGPSGSADLTGGNAGRIGPETADTATTGKAAPTSVDGKAQDIQEQPIEAAQGTNRPDQQYTLLPTWAAAYEGNCTGCHIPSDDRPSYHPTRRRESLRISTWFVDDNQQLGPNLQLENFQVSGFKVHGNKVYCSDCHTATNPQAIATNRSGRTADPHSVHQGIVAREGCIRCHGPRASQATEGVTSPISMRRVYDNRFLSTRDEAPYGNATGSTVGYGFAKYLHPETGVITPRSCGDCHGLYHGKGGFGFSFDASTRVGPRTHIRGGTGLLVNQTSISCGACHGTDVHAVHTNGKMNASVTFEQIMNLSIRVRKEGVAGAETCLECHGTSVVARSGSHWELPTAKRLGLIGRRDAPPNATVQTTETGDCAFCHQ
ncbi:MAG: hypothetical protein ABEJ27_06245 [Halodesulfurarchaeum sp.]